MSAISAQRRTWVDTGLPVQEERYLIKNVRTQQEQWHERSWQPTEDLQFILSTLVQEHTAALTKNNEAARASSEPLQPISDTKLIRLQDLWSRLFPTRKLEIGASFRR